MDYAKTGMRGGEVVQNVGGGICRAIIYGNNLEIGIIDRGEAGQGRWQFFFLVARGKEQGNGRTLRVARAGKIFDPRQLQRAIHHTQSIENPENGDETEERQFGKIKG